MSDWRHKAACLDQDSELFFPVGNTGPAINQIEAARAVCSRCPVRETCLRWALDTGQDAGVWGGLSEDERRSLKRRLARAARAEGIPAPAAPRQLLGKYVDVEPVAQVIHLAASAGVTLAQIAGRLGISDSTARDIKAGKTQMARKETVAIALGILERAALGQSVKS